MSDTQATSPFNGRLERAVLQSATPAIDTELGRNYYVETIRNMDQDRLIRVSHPTALDEPVYILVTCELVTKEVARALMRNFGDPATVKAVELATEQAAAPAEEEPGEEPEWREVLGHKGRSFRLASGKRYRVQYRAGGGSLREAVMTYLGLGLRGLEWDARPKHGTVTIEPKWLTLVHVVPGDTEGYVDRKVG